MISNLKPDPCDIPPAHTIEATIFHEFKGLLKDITPSQANFWKIGQRLDTVPNTTVENICVHAKIDRSQLTRYLIKLCECGAFSNPGFGATSRFPELFPGGEASPKILLQEKTTSQVNIQVGGPIADTPDTPDGPGCQPRLGETENQPHSGREGAKPRSGLATDSGRMGYKIFRTIGWHNTHQRSGVFDPSPSELAELIVGPGPDTESEIENDIDLDLELEGSDSDSSTVVSIGSNFNILSTALIAPPDTSSIFLSYPTQHIILTSAQFLLEQSCHAFIQKWYPQSLLADGFSEPENSELPRWFKLIMLRLPYLPVEAINLKVLQTPAARRYSTIDIIFSHLKWMRHSAVHRIKKESKSIVDMLQSTIIFAKFLKDDEARIGRFQRLLEKTLSLFEELKNEKQTLRENLEKELLKIKKSREILTYREKMMRVRIWREDSAIRKGITFDINEILDGPESGNGSIGVDGVDEPESGRPNRATQIGCTAEPGTLSRLTLRIFGNYLSSVGGSWRNVVEEGDQDARAENTVGAGSVSDDRPQGQDSMETFYSQLP
ncbi:hypothetical protein AOL_s00215g651 [Orbilia oligospora ATCC 24927]|uniref:Uncharacterized protein n=1 Tax=Arthrobotrys oligospora (strain ATCC 24927 / CBS 115.81 / DSM 1491) TaxID=756982 RepID=G1XUJ3_ARTOA|nr:hypothetical protein AOL_s00215g651 [Orbilia oligospora ATCC 24927]EGX43195.1 hypothetical protein AOL_s00215g651 [Orbilia oligospora ATCC 24927]